MNLVKNINQYNNEHTFFCEPIKNNIMNEGNFIRILYSNSLMVLNGVYLLVNFNGVVCEKYYNKYKCSFNVLNNKDIIDNLKIIEEDILKKYITNKIPLYKINEQLKSGYIKIFNDIGNHGSYHSFILKISGIWETHFNYGLTYKFINVKRQNN
jgi:hypothetical protein